MFRRKLSWAIALTIVAAGAQGKAQHGAVQGECRSHGGDPGSSKYSPLDQISTANVARLRIAWRRPAVDLSLSAGQQLSYSHDFRSTPLMIAGVLYASHGLGLIERSEEHTSELKSPDHLVCRLLRAK